MSRDDAFLEECRKLVNELKNFPSLAALRRSATGPALEDRLSRALARVRRHEPPAEPAPAPDPSRVLAAHWNIEHGNQYEAIAGALRDHPQLQAADLVFLNEVDLGMARSGNRDVAADLARTLRYHGVWAPLFFETTPGRDEDATRAAGQPNQEALFGLALLSRWPLADVRVVELPSPERFQFDVERMYGRHIALIATVLRPGEPFVAVSTHLEVHRRRSDRARQTKVLVAHLEREGRPVILAGDFNTHTFDRGRPWDPWFGAVALLLGSARGARRRLLHPDRPGGREPLFDTLRAARFEWHALNDRRPTLRLRLERVGEAGFLRLLPAAWIRGLRERIERRAALRLDWFAGRGWRRGRGATVAGLDGPGLASDHAPILGEFR